MSSSVGMGQFTGWRACGLVLLVPVFLAIVATDATAAAVVLSADEDLDSGVFRLSWSGGTLPYKTVTKASTPTACQVQSFSAAGLTQITLPVSASASGTTFYILSDSTTTSTPSVTISTVSPSTSSTTTASRVSVTGTVNPAGSPVCVNNLQATVTNGTFSVDNVLLALGANSLVAWTSLANGNTGSANSPITRQVLNQPPSIQILLSDDDCDRTPLVTVSFSDPEGQLDLNTFKAILNGTDVTSSYMGGSTFPSPLPPGSTGALWPVNQSQSFGPGTNVLRVTIADVKGSVSGDTFARFTDGSFIDYITPRAATPGATVSIFGCGFSPTAAPNIVKFGTTPATSVTPVGSYQLNVVVPPITNDVDVTVTVDGVTSNPRPFDLAFTAAPSASPTLVVAIDNQDNVYYTSNDNCIRKVTPTGGQSTFICIPEQITGMQFDSTRTILYVSSRGAPTADRQLVGSSDIYTFNSGYIRSVAPNGASSVIATFPATG